MNYPNYTFNTVLKDDQKIDYSKLQKTKPKGKADTKNYIHDVPRKFGSSYIGEIEGLRKLNIHTKSDTTKSKFKEAGYIMNRNILGDSSVQAHNIWKFPICEKLSICI